MGNTGLPQKDIGNAPIDIDGGSAMIYGVANAHGVQRVVIATTESYIRDHIIAAPSVKSYRER